MIGCEPLELRVSPTYLPVLGAEFLTPYEQILFNAALQIQTQAAQVFCGLYPSQPAWATQIESMLWVNRLIDLDILAIVELHT